MTSTKSESIFDLHAMRRERFRSVDTFEGVVNDPLSLHKYVYAQNDPMNRTDPSGHFSLGDINIVQTLSQGLRATLTLAGKVGKSLFTPSLTVGGFAIRSLIGAGIFFTKEQYQEHYIRPLAASLEKFASTLTSIDAGWANKVDQLARGMASNFEDNTVLNIAQMLFPHFGAGHLNVFLAALGTAENLAAVGRAEDTAMQFIKEHTGLDIKVDFDDMELVSKYVHMKLDPAKDVDLFDEVVRKGHSGDFNGALDSLKALVKHLEEQYSVTLSGTFHNVDVVAQLIAPKK
jgi:hypothetical protein